MSREVTLAAPDAHDHSDTAPSPLPEASLQFAFRIYKAILSPVLHAVAPSRCLYQPTCSEYAFVALSRFGILRGSWMAMRRLARCHPWGKGGLDPLPVHCDGTSPCDQSSPSQPDSGRSDRLS